jgi:hypothetical protein
MGYESRKAGGECCGVCVRRSDWTEPRRDMDGPETGRTTGWLSRSSSHAPEPSSTSTSLA